ncbi:MAG: hypothetical protein HY906_00755 [Deltaproteobacteria bacterium]|nr:hypothetical protein [Deltaproteobacteria bacterium]
MFRLKIALAAAVVLLIVTLGVFFTVTERVKRANDENVKAALERASTMYAYVSRAEASDFTRLAEDLATRSKEGKVADAFDAAIADDPAQPAPERERRTLERRKRAFVAVQVRNAELQAAARKADLLLVIDGAGKVVCRDVDQNEMFGDDAKSKFAAVGKALGGQAVKDIWNWQGRMLRVAVAPVRIENKVVGALAVGFVVTATEAQQKKREILGFDLAFFLEGKVHASSFAGPDGKEDPNRVNVLAAQIFDGGKFAQQAIDRQKATEIFPVAFTGERTVAIAAPMTGNSDNKKAGVVIVASLDRQQPGAGGMILALGIIAILVAIFSITITARNFIKPLDLLERGVADVINGNLEYTFPPLAGDLEGLANALNVMVCRLTGRPEPSEEGEDDDAPKDAAARWRGDPLFVEELGQAEVAQAQSGADAELQKLVNEPELVYLQRTFKEYLAARQKLGQAIDNLTLESFTGKLRQNEASLKDKYKCKAVRFRVVVKGTQVTLKPVPVY